MTATIPTFRTWKTIKLGTGLKSIDDFRKALKKAYRNNGLWGNDILSGPTFTVSPEEVEVELIVVSVAQLGFKDGATKEEIYACANELGLDLCPAEVGPQLCLQYTDQPKDEQLLIGMEPIADSDGLIHVFELLGRNDEGVQWLDCHDGSPDSFWGSGNRWVFMRRQQSRS